MQITWLLPLGLWNTEMNHSLGLHAFVFCHLRRKSHFAFKLQGKCVRIFFNVERILHMKIIKMERDEDDSLAVMMGFTSWVSGMCNCGCAYK